MSEFVRVDIPDFHGNHIDWGAATALIKDLKILDPEEIVYGGDGVDAGGTFSTHQRNYTNEMVESYEDDCGAANKFLDYVCKAAPRAVGYFTEGNHEAHVERWAARTFASAKDAEGLLLKYGPAAMLRLKERGIRYFKRSEQYMGIPIPGTIKLGKCFFVHGICHSRHAAAVHLDRFGHNVVFHHVHTAQQVYSRSVTRHSYMAACSGTLAKLQPLYRHTEPTRWTHGYGLQFVNRRTGTFAHFNVPIFKGVSLLPEIFRKAA